MNTDELTQARARMQTAKDQFSKAAVAVLKCDPDAEHMAAVALHELTAAQAELRRLTDPPASEWTTRARLS
jgi:hypothetical protein